MQVDQDKIRALAGFRSALRRFLAFSEAAASEAGITAQQYQAMLAVAAHEGAMPQGELAQEMLLKPNATVQLVDRLAAGGLVERERSDADRRAVRVSLTDAGRVLLFKLVADHLDQLKKREKQFADVLRRLRQTRAA
jgi:DNA-binding MarR family transcriptional regulator